ncbi:hypothetical protein DY000_02020642 [Brassica cretica]|uniref:Transposase-associated domain-containing protein n=1 Tax=Brassica cretica TaxID=69181 RepID=A0ABQ7E4A2_BRACR|nr:hypothetical protein DY000_02020642 [Brassica cretica]
MTDPYYADMKQHRRDADWRECVLYAHHKIPKKCTCGGPIRLETDEERMSYTNAKSLRRVGRVEEEVADQVKSRMKMEDEIKKMHEDINLLKKFVNYVSPVFN